MTSTHDLLDFAIDAAGQAGEVALSAFQSGVGVEWKSDGSPVTAADRAAELRLRHLIERRFPNHAVFGEELGESEVDSTHRWIIDPIDGTQSFIRGVPLFGVLVGLEIAGEMVLGVARFPALGETVSAATDHGCSWNGRSARVSRTSQLADAAVTYSSAAHLARLRPGAWTRLQEATRIQRGWGDCYGHCLVATGRVDIMVDPVLSPWDCAALLPILREAGGTFTDWTGQPTIDGGNGVSTNSLLFDQVMTIMRDAN